MKNDTHRDAIGTAEPSMEAMPIKRALGELETNAERGLATEEARRRLERYGPNAIEEKRISPVWRFFSFFRGPIPWMIEVSAMRSDGMRRRDS